MRSILIFIIGLAVGSLITLFFGIQGSTENTMPAPKNESQSDLTLDIREENLPSDIHPVQVRPIGRIGDRFYAFALQPNMNFNLNGLPENFQIRFVGLLAREESESKWKKFLEVKDKNPSDPNGRNNPIAFWWEGPFETDQVPHIRVMDTNGAGSGEGVIKELVPEDIGMEQWKVVSCAYGSLDLGIDRSASKEEKNCYNAEVKI